MTAVLLRFLVGGAIVATIPYLARHTTPLFAAVVMLVPAISLLSFVGIVREAESPKLLFSVAKSALIAAPLLMVFFGTICVAIRCNLPPYPAIAAGFLAWLILAIAIQPLAP